MRQAALGAACEVMLALPPAYVGAALGGGDAAVASGLEYIREWALLVADGDSDEDCRRVRGAGG